MDQVDIDWGRKLIAHRFGFTANAMAVVYRDTVVEDNETYDRFHVTKTTHAGLFEAERREMAYVADKIRKTENPNVCYMLIPHKRYAQLKLANESNAKYALAVLAVVFVFCIAIIEPRVEIELWRFVWNATRLLVLPLEIAVSFMVSLVPLLNAFVVAVIDSTHALASPMLKQLAKPVGCI